MWRYVLESLRSALEHLPSPGPRVTERSLVLAYRRFVITPPGRALLSRLGSLPASWRLYLLGGVPRDLLVLGPDAIGAADADIVVENCTTTSRLFDTLCQAYGRSRVQRNRFGGAKVVGLRGAPALDFWRVEDHLVPRGSVRPRTINDLLPHCLTNVDAIAIALREIGVLEHGALAGINERSVELIHPPVAEPPALMPQLVHLLLLWERYSRLGFSFGPQFETVLACQEAAAPTAALLRETEEKLRERRAEGVMMRLERIASYLDALRSHSALVAGGLDG